MKKIIILIIFFVTHSFCQAQTLYNLAQNEMKSWKLRGRLVGDHNNRDVYNGFMKIGQGAGMSNH